MTTNRDLTNMTENERARYYENHKDDESLWSPKAVPQRKIRSRRGQGPSTTFTLRLTGNELTRIAEAAFISGTNPTDFIRSAALKAAEAQGGPTADRDREIARDLQESRQHLQHAEALLRGDASPPVAP